MDFKFTEDQLMLKEMFKDFTDKEIRPRADAIEKSGELDRELYQKLADIGAYGIVAPEEYGGMGMGFVELMIVMEEVCKGLGTIYNWVSGANGVSTSAVLTFGTEEQKKMWVPTIISGEEIGAFALTEPNAGSDAYSIKTKAEKNGDKVIINGTKTFITAGSCSDRIVTITRYFENGEEKGYAAFMVPSKSEGITFSEEHKMGLHGTPLNEVSYQDVEVPLENMIGKVGQGMEVALDGLNEVRTSCAAFAIGLAQEAVDLAVKYSKERMQFGKRISQFQNTQFVLAECQTKVDAARLMVYRAASQLGGSGVNRTYPAMAKYYAGEVCNDVVRKCLQVFGGYGYMSEFPIERIYRDAKIAEIFDGTAEVQKILISKAMGVR